MEMLSKLKEYYSLSDTEFLERIGEPSISGLPNPFSLNLEFATLIERLKSYVTSAKKVVIYGDYDVDGLTSTTILVGTFLKLGLEVGYYIPSRYIDGYGINKKRVDQFKAKGYEVIITVDNGISEIETVEYAKSLGFEVVIIDHHEQTKTELPKADYIFHQYISNLTTYNISAAFLALMVSYGMLGEYDPYYVTLAGIAVFSDAMPLIGANLILARLALIYANVYRYSTIMHLTANPIHIAYDDFSYSLIPALNSIGRVDKTTWINNIVKYLLDPNNGATKPELAKSILDFNERRKEIVKNYDIEQLSSEDKVVYSNVDLPLGIIGLLANKIMSKVHKPVVLFTEDPLDKDLYVGSIRTPKGYKTADCLKDNCDFLARFGGHDEAAGFTLKKEDVAKFKETLNEHLVKVNETKEEHNPIVLDDISTIVTDYKVVEEFGPYGNSFEAPLFSYTLDKSRFNFSRDGKHLLTTVGSLKILAFNTSLSDYPEDKYTFSGTLSRSVFRGVTSIDLSVKEATPKTKIEVD